MLRTNCGTTIPFCCAVACLGPMDVVTIPTAATATKAEPIFADSFIMLLPKLSSTDASGNRDRIPSRSQQFDCIARDYTGRAIPYMILDQKEATTTLEPGIERFLSAIFQLLDYGLRSLCVCFKFAFLLGFRHPPVEGPRAAPRSPARN